MKRVLSIVALVAALTLGTGGSAMAHRITVTTPDGTVVRDGEDLARNLTPRIFDSEGNHVGEGGTDSAASQGTNTACEAIPEHAAVTITGGSC